MQLHSTVSMIVRDTLRHCLRLVLQLLLWSTLGLFLVYLPLSASTPGGSVMLRKSGETPQVPLHVRARRQAI